MKTLGRLVFRDGGDEHTYANDGLILGMLLRSGRSFFKPGYVYELREVMGTITIHELGPSWIKPSRTQPCWAHSFERVVVEAGKYFVLTAEEYQNECEKGRK